MQLFGILNITPDSFSDGDKYTKPEVAVKAAYRMMDDGAIAIDIGAESTRPGATMLSAEDEWQRLVPVLNGLKDLPVSIDTRNPTTAQKALQQYHNIKFLNDVSGFENEQMVQLGAKYAINIIVMHSLTVPADKSIVLTSPPIETLGKWIHQKFSQLASAGISPDKIIFDPGIGFGKTTEQSRELIENAAELAKISHKLGTKLLYGHSRKSFLGDNTDERDLETAQICAHLQVMGVDYARVHNVQLSIATINQEMTY